MPSAARAGAKPLDKADYVKQMQTIGRDLSTSLNSLGTATTVDSRNQPVVMERLMMIAARSGSGDGGAHRLRDLQR